MASKPGRCDWRWDPKRNQVDRLRCRRKRRIWRASKLDGAIVTAPLKDETGGNSGAAYIFDRQADGDWAETKIVPNDNSAGDRFGYTAAITETASS